ncbi:MAG: hypothetical protein Q8P42_03980 [Gallionella sp.]|nr:hypothetical protein [Gallionella sp.]
MNKHKGFVLRLSQAERERAQRLAREQGVSENRLYAEIIHDGLLIQEQMAYLRQMQKLGALVSQEEALALLDRSPDVEPAEHDMLGA